MEFFLLITWLPLAFESLIIDKIYKGEFTLGDLCKVSDIFLNQLCFF